MLNHTYDYHEIEIALTPARGDDNDDRDHINPHNHDDPHVQDDPHNHDDPHDHDDLHDHNDDTAEKL